MSDRDIEMMLRIAGLCAIGAFWPLLKGWLAKHGLHYRSMKEQRQYEAELDARLERERQQAK